MKHSNCACLIILFSIMLGAFKPCFAQSKEDVERTKKEFEQTRPGERTYTIDELIKLLDPADSIMPKAKAITHEKWQKLRGATFGTVVSWGKAKDENSVDGFTASYSQKPSELKQLILENILTNSSSFSKFMEGHKKGFYEVSVWKAGYLIFTLLEGRKEQKGIRFIAVPVKPKLFELIQAHTKKP